MQATRWKVKISSVIALAMIVIGTAPALADSLKETEELLRSISGDSSGSLKVQPVPPAKPVSLEGKTATGSLGKINGGTKFYAEFKGGGVVALRTAEEQRTFNGTWSQDGNKISMKAGASVFEGTLDGSKISGTRGRRNSSTLVDTNDVWELTIDD